MEQDVKKSISQNDDVQQQTNADEPHEDIQQETETQPDEENIPQENNSSYSDVDSMISSMSLHEKICQMIIRIYKQIIIIIINL